MKMGRRLRCSVGTRSRASVVACPHDAKRAGPAAQERIPTGPTAHFDRNERHGISATGHYESLAPERLVAKMSMSLNNEDLVGNVLSCLSFP